MKIIFLRIFLFVGFDTVGDGDGDGKCTVRKESPTLCRN